MDAMTFPKFFVYVIESPSDKDLYHKRSEGDLLAKALELDSISCATKLIVSFEAFQAALYVGLPEEMQARQGFLPVIHLSMHGNEDGLQLTNGYFVTWEELKRLLAPINKAMSGALLLCISACKGINAMETAMSQDDPPFLALISHNGSPAWSDTAVAYLTLYHRLSKGAPISEAIKAMRAASGDDGFMPITGEYARDRFLDTLQQVKPEQVQQAIQDETKKHLPQTITGG